jgi:hypothetical protein
MQESQIPRLIPRESGKRLGGPDLTASPGSVRLCGSGFLRLLGLLGKRPLNQVVLTPYCLPHPKPIFLQAPESVS